ncbi:4-carboxymuconolactone decarboxylase [Devosia sp.]|uniref:4-carboxymuconolactone decarboxylase n=1 Tax=Devosia sp. TaxID=1871048 RepID=UPI002F1916B4
MSEQDSRFQAGMATRRAVLGESYVEGAERGKTKFTEDFQRFITETAWGAVWSRPGLTRRERSLITIALLAAGGHDEEVAMHVRATANTGATAQDIKEVLLHVALYAGIPAANKAYKTANEELAKLDTDGGIA